MTVHELDLDDLDDAIARGEVADSKTLIGLLQARARLRSSLVCYGWWHRLRVLPQALVFALLTAIYVTMAGGESGHGDEAHGHDEAGDQNGAHPVSAPASAAAGD